MNEIHLSSLLKNKLFFMVKLLKKHSEKIYKSQNLIKFCASTSFFKIILATATTTIS